MGEYDVQRRTVAAKSSIGQNNGRAYIKPHSINDLIQMAAIDPNGLSVSDCHRLHQTIGNQATCQLMKKTGPGQPVAQLHTEGAFAPVGGGKQGQKLDYVETGMPGRDMTKQQYIDEIGQKICAQLEGLTPHVAVSLHHGHVWLAINRNSKFSQLDSSKKNLARQAVKAAYMTYAGSIAGKPQYQAIKDWTDRYKDKEPEPVSPTVEEESSESLHAEQMLSGRILNAYKAGLIAPKASDVPGGRRVIRMGGTLPDCARCHVDHFGSPKMYSDGIRKMPTLYKTPDGKMVFDDPRSFEGTDGQLKNFGRILRTSGWHAGNDGASSVWPGQNPIERSSGSMQSNHHLEDI